MAGYNGYRNYPTWAVSNWYDGDSYIREIVQDCMKGGMPRDEAIQEVTEYMSEEIQDMYDDAYSNLPAVIVDAFLDTYEHADIDFEEVAKVFVEYYWQDSAARSGSRRSAGKSPAKKLSYKTGKAAKNRR